MKIRPFNRKVTLKNLMNLTRSLYRSNIPVQPVHLAITSLKKDMESLVLSTGNCRGCLVNIIMKIQALIFQSQVHEENLTKISLPGRMVCRGLTGLRE